MQACFINMLSCLEMSPLFEAQTQKGISSCYLLPSTEAGLTQALAQLLHPCEATESITGFVLFLTNGKGRSFWGLKSQSVSMTWRRTVRNSLIMLILGWGACSVVLRNIPSSVIQRLFLKLLWGLHGAKDWAVFSGYGTMSAIEMELESTKGIEPDPPNTKQMVSLMCYLFGHSIRILPPGWVWGRMNGPVPSRSPSVL